MPTSFTPPQEFFWNGVSYPYDTRCSAQIGGAYYNSGSDGDCNALVQIYPAFDVDGNLGSVQIQQWLPDFSDVTASWHWNNVGEGWYIDGVAGTATVDNGGCWAVGSFKSGDCDATFRPFGDGAGTTDDPSSEDNMTGAKGFKRNKGFTHKNGFTAKNGFTKENGF